MFSKIKNNYEFYKKQYFRGEDIYCPFCSGFYKAQKFKLSKELSGLCPVCGSEARERTILLFLLSRTGMLSGGKRILYIGESGMMIRYFENFPDTDIKEYSARSDFRIRDERKKTDYPDSSFDIIICNYVLEKHSSPKLLMDELSRILKPEGIMLLQANVDPGREETAEFSHMYYKDRLKLYGIPGNLRRYGKDYPDVIRSYGLNLSRLKFTEGFEILPELSFDKDEIIYIAHKTERPLLKDDTDELESDMDEQRFNESGNIADSFIYTLFFILPELIRKGIFSLLGNINEREENKRKTVYMIYIIIYGLTFYWGSLFFFKASGYFRFPGAFIVHAFIALPLYAFAGMFGLMVMGMYVMTNDKAGIIKKGIVMLILSLTMLLGILAGFS